MCLKRIPFSLICGVPTIIIIIIIHFTAVFDLKIITANVKYVFSRNQNISMEQNTLDNDNTQNIDTFDLLFTHICKTGGTMIENLLMYHYNIPVGLQFDRHTNHSILKTNPFQLSCGADYHVPLSWILDYTRNNKSLLSEISPSYYSKYKNLTKHLFTVVRNPFSRFISLYQYCAAKNGCTELQFKWFTKHCHTYIKNKTYCTQLGVIFNTSTFNPQRGSIWSNFDFCSVSNFNSFAYTKLNYLIDEGSNNDGLSCGDIAQYEYVYYENKQMINTILKTENLSNELADLLNKYKGFSVNKTLIDKYRKMSAYDKICKDLSINSLNDVNKDLLIQFYQKDFLYFNYSYTFM